MNNYIIVEQKHNGGNETMIISEEEEVHPEFDWATLIGAVMLVARLLL